ncbi:D-alanine--D-alanine ligase [Vagococcus acidifermentans]|uniref:D-alanine--D-alanine ligase n=1 Tax=Vagococcus acidifermentans TaxID=564710 RepID=A0A430AUS8_9ENTE|nr:D-alanine--D-alanine ligase [Vagococcus acidifermentans]RSU11814.1 D-alanine--D-alanine ligase A [Vagococcus acidifermentans]
MKIALIYGGKSAEHDISILSAFSILQAIYYDYYQVQLIYITQSGDWLKGPLLAEAPAEEHQLHIDKNGQGKKITPCEIKEDGIIVFPVLHGPNGEDGTIQGLFEILEVPYVGAGVLASACGMDKIMAKQVFQQVSIPQLPYVPVTKMSWKLNPEEIYNQCEGSLIYPMFVKPANMGSSVGISKAADRDELIAAIKEAFRFDYRVVVEQGIDAREIEVAVLGNEEIRTTLAGEIVKDVAFYDYESKYIDNQVSLQIPAKVSEDVHKKAREYAEKAYAALDGCGLTRCDFFLTSNGELFLNEVNTMPGFTPYSMYPLLWKQMGLNYGDLLEELIQLAKLRFEEKQNVRVIK